MLIGVWQEYALARQLQARQAADRNVQLVLQGDDRAGGDEAGSHEAIPRRRRRASPPQPQQGPKPLAPAAPPPPRPSQPWITACGAGCKQTPKRQCQQQHAAMGSAPCDLNRHRRLRDVERMRRAYLSGGQRPVEIREEMEGGVEAASGDRLPSRAVATDPGLSQEGGGSANEEDEVDELMRWVNGLENGEGSEMLVVDLP